MERFRQMHLKRSMAAMLAGPDYTQTSLESARELVQKAEEWKGS